MAKTTFFQAAAFAAAMLFPCIAAAQEETTEPAGEPLVERLRSAADSYQPADDAALAAAKTKAASTVNVLWTYLGTQRVGPGWKSFLTLEAVKAEVAKGTDGDLTVLETAVERFNHNAPGLERPRFADAGDALEEYVVQLRRAKDPGSAEEYKDRMGQLADAIATYETRFEPAELNKAGEQLAWLEARGLATQITPEVRDKYWGPNLLVTVDDDLVLAGFGRKVNETGRVSDYIVGAYVSGTQHTTGEVVAELVPNDKAAVIRNVFRARAQTRTIGRKSGASVWSRGTTRIAAVKVLYFTAAGFSTRPADANAISHNTPTGVNANRGWLNCIANGIVWNQVRSTQRQSEYESARKAEARTQRRLNTEAGKRIAEANERYQSRFRKRLEERNAFPELKFSTTESALHVVGLRAGEGEMAATEPPPEVDGNPIMSMRIHESMVENLARAMYGGRKLTGKEYREEMEAFSGDSADAEMKENDDEPKEDDDWDIVFDQKEPVNVTFDEDMVKVVIRGSGFRSGAKGPYNFTMDTHIHYTPVYSDGVLIQSLADPPEKMDDKDDKFQRIDSVPPGIKAFTDEPLPEDLENRDDIVRASTMLRDGFFARFATEAPFMLEPSGNWKSVGDLVVTRMEARDGWLTLYFDATNLRPKDLPARVALRR